MSETQMTAMHPRWYNAYAVIEVSDDGELLAKDGMVSRPPGWESLNSMAGEGWCYVATLRLSDELYNALLLMGQVATPKALTE